MVPGDYDTVDVTPVSEYVGDGLSGYDEAQICLYRVLGSASGFGQCDGHSDLPCMIDNRVDVIPVVCLFLPYRRRLMPVCIGWRLECFHRCSGIGQSLTSQFVNHGDGVVDFWLSGDLAQTLRQGDDGSQIVAHTVMELSCNSGLVDCLVTLLCQVLAPFSLVRKLLFGPVSFSLCPGYQS